MIIFFWTSTAGGAGAGSGGSRGTPAHRHANGGGNNTNTINPGYFFFLIFHNSFQPPTKHRQITEDNPRSSGDYYSYDRSLTDKYLE